MVQCYSQCQGWGLCGPGMFKDEWRGMYFISMLSVSSDGTTRAVKKMHEKRKHLTNSWQENLVQLRTRWSFILVDVNAIAVLYGSTRRAVEILELTRCFPNRLRRVEASRWRTNSISISSETEEDFLLEYNAFEKNRNLE